MFAHLCTVVSRQLQKGRVSRAKPTGYLEFTEAKRLRDGVRYIKTWKHVLSLAGEKIAANESPVNAYGYRDVLCG